MSELGEFSELNMDAALCTGIFHTELANRVNLSEHKWDGGSARVQTKAFVNAMREMGI